MINKLKSLLCFILLVLWATSAKSEHSDSLAEYETYRVNNNTYMSDDCFSTGKVIWNASEIDQTYMPGIISKNATTTSTASSTVTGSQVGHFLFGVATLGIGVAINMLIMVDACSNIYNVMAHEYINRNNGIQCQNAGGKVDFVPSSNTLTASDVPFFYHCDPTWDPITNTTLSAGSSADAAKIGHTYGYMGTASQYCTGNMKQWGDWAKTNQAVGKIRVESATRMFTGSSAYSLCTTTNRVPSDNSQLVSASKNNEEWYIFPVHVRGYYKLFETDGKIKLCAAAHRTMFPIRVACGYIAPPGEEDPVDDYLKAYVANTRCSYLMQSRTDLQSLGNALPLDDANGANRSSVKKFLSSELHFTSTIVGCLKDMLVKVFITQKNDYQGQAFFQVVQARLKQIVLAVIVLYVSLVGIKIITSPEPPKRPEVIMMILKLALVMYFATGDAFYKNDGTGLYPQLIQVTDEIANYFLEAQNAGDPLGFCTYKYNGRNLLGENSYTGVGVTPTIGFNHVKLTLWDLVDCKLITYLNFGSCDYSVGGLVAAWAISTAFWVSGIGILFALVAFIYCFMILLVIFRYTHIFILSLIVVTVLIFLSPIFIVFALFEPTKGIFDKWLRVVLGYLIYPALLFAFLAVMLATLDAVYYGFTVPDNSAGINIQSQCKDVNSIYCVMMRPLATNSNDACTMSFGYVSKHYVKPENISYIGSFYKFDKGALTELFEPLLKLMLFSLLFYLFMSAVASFMAALLQITDVSDKAGGSINAANIVGNIVSAIKPKTSKDKGK